MEFPPGLYITATPIGNLGDITLRALDVLRSAALIVCEDTRVTGRLLARYGINTSMIAYHDHNADGVRPSILRAISEGKAVALVTDAGTPLVSDPGYKLVRAVTEAGYYVTSLPGPSSLLAALTLAGLPTDRFLFEGFLPVKDQARRARLEELAGIDATLVFFERASRLPDTLETLRDILGEREAAVARELTKIYEEVRRAPLAALVEHYRREGPPKGEAVVIIGPPAERGAIDSAALDECLLFYLDAMRTSEAAEKVSLLLGLPKKQVYERALALKGKNAG